MTNDQTTPEQRADERIPVAMPLHIGEVTGITRDLSASGVFFEIDAAATIGSSIHCELELKTSTGKFILKCQGTIVRTETHGDRTGVAIKIVDSRISADDTANQKI